MDKVYVMDSVVLLQEPDSIFDYKDGEIVLLKMVLEAIDKRKRYMDDLGVNARYFTRMLFSSELDLNIRFEEDNEDEKFFEDNFLKAVLKIKKKEELKDNPRPVIIVSKDALLRVKADAIGLIAEDYIKYSGEDNES